MQDHFITFRIAAPAFTDPIEAAAFQLQYLGPEALSDRLRSMEVVAPPMEESHSGQYSDPASAAELEARTQEEVDASRQADLEAELAAEAA